MLEPLDSKSRKLVPRSCRKVVPLSAFVVSWPWSRTGPEKRSKRRGMSFGKKRADNRIKARIYMENGQNLSHNNGICDKMLQNAR
jgi:hypothetical protein